MSTLSGTSAPEYKAFRECYGVLVNTVKQQVGETCDSLYAKSYIPETVRDYTRTDGIPDLKKAQKLVDFVSDAIKTNSNVLRGFIAILKLEGPFNDDIVKKLEESYRKACEHKSFQSSEKSSDVHQADDGDVSSGDESFHSAIDDRNVFVCPYCQECSLQQFYSKEGCPKKSISHKTRSTNLFPYLDVTGLADEHVFDLEERLISDTREIMIKFSDFSLCVRKSLEEMDIPLDKLQDCVLSAVILQKDQGVSALDTEHKERVLAANSLARIFSILRVYDYISFLNYQIIELLIQHHGNADENKRLKQYLVALRTFCQRSIFEVPLSVFSSHRSRKTAKVFALKCTERTLTLQGVRAMQNNVAEILGLEFNALQLCSVKKGCVELHFLVSAAVAEHIFPLSPSQQSALSEIGARLLPYDEENEREITLEPQSPTTLPEGLSQSTAQEIVCPSLPKKLKLSPSRSVQDENTLHTACERGDIETVKLMIDKGADVNEWGIDGNTLLYAACKNGHTETAQVLIDGGANVHQPTRDENTPLLAALEKGHTDTAQLLIDRGADVNWWKTVCIPDGNAPLHAACEKGDTEIAQWLFDRRASVNSRNSAGSTPLLAACENGHTETALLLIDRGAYVNQRHSQTGNTPLHVACENGHTETAQLLINKGADVNKGNTDENTPLLVALEKGHIETAQLLIDQRADVHLCNKEGNTPLLVALEKGHIETAQLLVDRGADVDQSNNEGNTPLLVALAKGHIETAQLLIDGGADMYHCNKEENTPLHIALKKGITKTAQLLIHREKNVNRCNLEGNTPLHVACENGDTKTAQLLIKKGAVVHKCNKEGNTPLHVACKNGHNDTAQLLIDSGADLNRQNRKENTPLHVVCEKGHTETAQLLIDRGADLHHYNKEGNTAFRVASMRGDTIITQLLIDRGVKEAQVEPDTTLSDKLESLRRFNSHSSTSGSTPG
ncbi:CARD- and ANK-domain containing inflammasome adapter protein-like isoform X1 [Halichondria panicea]|uniref:CARD- and ANK-domain containing inflammasome adapter protein-like isoform X1 n=1 Tax=Halichondria panicea TaxID=6063 RepID=UPI00312BB26C